MAWERLEILMMPRTLVWRRASMNRWRQGSISAIEEPVETAPDGADWHPAVATLGKLLAREARFGTRVHIALSNLWVRAHLLPATSANLSENEMLILARSHFARQYPETGQDAWTFRLALQGTRLLAAGMESGLVEAIRVINAGAGARLGRMEPLFGYVFDRSEKALANTTGWMLLDEPGMLSLAFIEQGRLMSLHGQRCETGRDEIAAQLLERQSALLAQQSTEIRVFSIDGRALRLPPPWRVVLHQSIFNAGDGAKSTTAPAPFSRQH